MSQRTSTRSFTAKLSRRELVAVDEHGRASYEDRILFEADAHGADIPAAQEAFALAVEAHGPTHLPEDNSNNMRRKKNVAWRSYGWMAKQATRGTPWPYRYLPDFTYHRYSGKAQQWIGKTVVASSYRLPTYNGDGTYRGMIVPAGAVGQVIDSQGPSVWWVYFPDHRAFCRASEADMEEVHGDE